jgi:hypothetical protein
MVINPDRKMGPKEAQLKAQREAAAKTIKPGPFSYVPETVVALRALVEGLEADVARLKRELAQARAVPGLERLTSADKAVLGQKSADSCPVCAARKAADAARKQRQRASENE